MSTISSFDKPLGFYPEPKSGAVLWRFLTVVRTYWIAILGGLAAARTYHELTTRGVPHEVAVKKMFDRHFDAR